LEKHHYRIAAILGVILENANPRASNEILDMLLQLLLTYANNATIIAQSLDDDAISSDPLEYPLSSVRFDW